MFPAVADGQSVAVSVSAVDKPQASVSSGNGGTASVGTFSTFIIAVYSGVNTALEICSATVVAIFGDSEQSGSKAQQCQRGQSVTAILGQKTVQTVQSRLFKFTSNIQCSAVAFRVQ